MIKEFKLLMENEFINSSCNKYFGIIAYTTFIRQLNFYGFENISRNSTEKYFIHPLFDLNNPTKRYDIKKKK